MKLIRLLKRDLAREVREWQQDGVIDDTQAHTICARYGIDLGTIDKDGHGHRVLVGLGYLFIGLALITLISHNWEEIPRATRMGGLIGITLLLNLLGLLRFHQGNDDAASNWLLAGGLCYGASIMLIAQIYHIGEHYPDGIFWWALGTLPAGLLLRSTALMLLSGTLAFTWFFVESGLDFYPSLFPLFLVAIGWFLLRGRQNSLLFLALAAGIALWIEYSLAWQLEPDYSFAFGPELLVVGAAITLLYHGVANWLSNHDAQAARDYGALLRLWVVRLTIGGLLLMSFEGAWRQLLAETWDAPALAVGLTIAAVIASLWLTWRAGQSLLPGQLFSFWLLANLAGLLLVGERQYADLFQIADNLALIALGTLLIMRGLQQHISHYFYLGVTTILLTGLLRYFDLVGDYIGATLLFAVFAAILLSAAKYWRHYQEKHGGGA